MCHNVWVLRTNSSSGWCNEGLMSLLYWILTCELCTLPRPVFSFVLLCLPGLSEVESGDLWTRIPHMNVAMVDILYLQLKLGISNWVCCQHFPLAITLYFPKQPNIHPEVVVPSFAPTQLQDTVTLGCILHKCCWSALKVCVNMALSYCTCACCDYSWQCASKMRHTRNK